MPNGIQRAALYIRVSTEEQAQHGLSLAEQRATLEEYVKAQGLRVAGVYADEGISARKRYNRRPALLRLLSDVRDGLIDIILFTKLDRWFRNVGDYYEVQRVLDDCGVSWRAVREDYETVTASGRLKVNIMLSVAQDEADRTGERIRAVFESKLARNEPISGKVPLGYKIEDKKMVVDPATAPIAQDIFRAYLGGRSVNALRKYVMDTYGIVYCHTSYKNMLRNTRYIGRAHGVDGFCEPLISPEDFAKVQEILAVRAQRNSGRPRGSIYLFSGLVYCSECGNRLSSHTINGRYVYYRCSKNQKTHQCPNKKHTSEAALENWLLENVVNRGTGTGAQISGMTVAGKTGSTSSNYDRWFVGYTPYYTAAVWVGYDQQERIRSNGNPAPGMWKKVMEPLHEGLENKDFNTPDGLVQRSLCAESGMLLNDYCAMDPRGVQTTTGWFSLR